MASSGMLDQLCDLLIPKLEERLANHLPSNQRGEDSDPCRDAAVSLCSGG